MEAKEYKEFRVLIEDPDNIRVQKPNRDVLKSNVERDRVRDQIIEVHNRWLAEGKIKRREELVVIGSILFRTLFDDNVSRVFKEEFDKAQKQPDTYLRLVLVFEQNARELAELPWEYLYYPDSVEQGRGFFIATRGRLILTRHVPVCIEEELKPEKKPLRILIVVSQPKGLRKVQYKPVVEAIEDLKNRFYDAIAVNTLPDPIDRSMPQPTLRRLAEKVNDFKPHVLHFIGHGKYKKEGGSLALVREKDENNPRWVKDIDLADCFMDYQPRLVFLHACEGARSDSYRAFRGVALQLVYSKVPAVVAMQYPIRNKVANLFAQKFYQSLGQGKPIDVAVQEGRNELGMFLDEGKSFSSRAFGSPVVYLQSEEGIIFAGKKPSPHPVKVPCPHPDCDGKVSRGDNYCITCKACGRKGELMQCPYPNCLHWPVSKEWGFCSRCGEAISAERRETLKKEAETRAEVYKKEAEIVRARKNVVSEDYYVDSG